MRQQQERKQRALMESIQRDEALREQKSKELEEAQFQAWRKKRAMMVEEEAAVREQVRLIRLQQDTKNASGSTKLPAIA